MAGILAWMVAGCLRWQTEGLNPPEAVKAATAAYLEAEDALSAWIEERCERAPSTWEKTADLFASWKAWAERSGEPPGCLGRAALTGRAAHVFAARAERATAGERLPIPKRARRRRRPNGEQQTTKAGRDPSDNGERGASVRRPARRRAAAARRAGRVMTGGALGPSKQIFNHG